MLRSLEDPVVVERERYESVGAWVDDNFELSSSGKRLDFDAFDQFSRREEGAEECCSAPNIDP